MSLLVGLLGRAQRAFMRFVRGLLSPLLCASALAAPSASADGTFSLPPLLAPWFQTAPAASSWFPLPIPIAIPTPAVVSHPKCALSPDAKGLVARSVTVGSRTATYATFAPPSYSPSKPLPVVVAFHGANMTKEQFVDMLRDTAVAKRFLLVVPEGSVVTKTGFTWAAADAQTVKPMLADVESCYAVDTKHRIVEGYSSGGAMAYWTGLADANSYVGIAIDAGSLNAAEATAKKTLVPGAAWHVPVSLVHGTSDSMIAVTSSRYARARLLAAGHPTQLHEFDGDHGFEPKLFAISYDELMAGG